MPAPSIAVIIPVYNARRTLMLTLASLAESTVPPSEIIVVDDGSSDYGLQAIPLIPGLRQLRNSAQSGPAHARNLGARASSADIFLFVDADVCVRPGTVERMRRPFLDPSVDAVIGSYDSHPSAPGFVSQYKNLMQHFVHQEGKHLSSTFWSGCGAIRREVFFAHEGFNEQYRRSEIEDIEFGYRMIAAGRRILLDREVQVTHLKAWSFWELVRSDIFDRAIPWTLLILRTSRMPDDLNLRKTQKESVVLVWLAIIVGIAGLGRHGESLAAAGLFLGTALLLNRQFYAFLARARGTSFGLQAIPMHLLYFIYSGAAFAAGLAIYASDFLRSALPSWLASRPSE